jgi:hypothetical protein
VALLGEIEMHSQATEDGNGGVHMSTHVRPSGVVGIGLVSGKMYRGTGGTFEAEGYDADGYPATYSFVNNFRIVGQGPGNNLLMHHDSSDDEFRGDLPRSGPHQPGLQVIEYVGNLPAAVPGSSGQRAFLPQPTAEAARPASGLPRFGAVRSVTDHTPPPEDMCTSFATSCTASRGRSARCSGSSRTWHG